MKESSLTNHDLDPETLRLNLPDRPGVYLFKDSSDRVIYVGKAKNLKKRVLSYFKSSGGRSYKTELMMKKAQGLNYILTATENEAFILEDSFVKRYMPRYNIILRDDKRFPCLRLDIEDTYPRLSIVRKIKKDGALYFGPYSSANAVRSTLKLINRIFQLRKCKSSALPKRSRACLNNQLGRCFGPCAHEVDHASYHEVVNQVRLFLEGRNQELVRQLKRNMEWASDQLDFERAARIRDKLRAVERVLEHQDVVSPKMQDLDVIGLAQKNGIYELVILFIRRGVLSGSRDYRLKNKEGSSNEVMEAFLKQYYHRESFIPKNILISEPIEDFIPIRGWLSELAERRVSVHHPQKGEKLRLVNMAVTNAENFLARPSGPREEDLIEMARSVLRLKRLPESIEGLDISNLHGNLAVGTIVSFVNGLPHKEGYRNYKIERVEGIDDYGMMSEVVSRRVSKGNLPYLFVVDGGKGHLLTVKKVMDRYPDGEAPDVVAIAKAHEGGEGKRDRIYIHGRKNPLNLKVDHPVLLLLMRIRDEAHRRAITYHRKLRGKDLRKSQLDLIPGIGLKRKNILLKQFGDIDNISKVKLEDLVLVPGISRSLAQDILKFFNKDHEKEKNKE